MSLCLKTDTDHPICGHTLASTNGTVVCFCVSVSPCLCASPPPSADLSWYALLCSIRQTLVSTNGTGHCNFGRDSVPSESKVSFFVSLCGSETPISSLRTHSVHAVTVNKRKKAQNKMPRKLRHISSFRWICGRLFFIQQQPLRFDNFCRLSDYPRITLLSWSTCTCMNTDMMLSTFVMVLKKFRLHT